MSDTEPIDVDSGAALFADALPAWTGREYVTQPVEEQRISDALQAGETLIAELRRVRTQRPDVPTGGRCGYTVIDSDDVEEPCDRPATGWRWYQDCAHEDALDVACEFHANEGGRRIAEADAEVRRLRAENEPEGGEIVMRELGAVKRERDEARAEVERLTASLEEVASRLTSDVLTHPLDRNQTALTHVEAALSGRSRPLALVTAERDGARADLSRTVGDLERARAKVGPSSLYDALYVAMYGSISVGAEEREAVAQLAESMAVALAAPVEQAGAERCGVRYVREYGPLGAPPGPPAVPHSCSLPAGHDGNHRSVVGFSWAGAERPRRRFTCPLVGGWRTCRRRRVMRVLLAEVRYRAQRVGYWLRPYSDVLDARRWRWRSSGRCGFRTFGEMTATERAALIEAVRAMSAHGNEEQR